MLEKIISILEHNIDLAGYGESQSVPSIGRAEDLLGVKFPESYRQFLVRWGWLSFGPNEYFGLGTQYGNVVTKTEWIRASRGLPVHLVVVCDHDGDEYVCLDASAMREKECPVVIWDSPTRVVSRTRAATFADFLESDIRGFVEE